VADERQPAARAGAAAGDWFYKGRTHHLDLFVRRFGVG
jgi:hypothetical protein